MLEGKLEVLNLCLLALENDRKRIRRAMGPTLKLQVVTLESSHKGH